VILRNRTVVALLAAEIVSTTGSQMSAVAIPWFVLVTTGSATRMSWVAASEIAAMGIFGILSGRLATRAGARTTLLACDMARAPLTLAIPLLYAADLLPFVVLLALVFAIGAFSAPAFGARIAIVPDVVGEDERVVGKAAAVFQAANRLTILLGPVAAGVLIGLVGATSVLYIDAATYCVSIALVWLFVPRTAPHERDSPGLDDFFAGAKFIWRERLLRAWMLGMLVIELCWQALFVAIPFLVYVDYGRNPHLVGFIFGGFGAGAILGSVFAFRLLDRVEPLLMASVGMLAQVVPLVLLTFDAPAWVEVLALFGSGFINPFVNSAAGGVMTVRTPRSLRQQVSAFSLGMSGVVSPLGVLAVGPALAAWGARPVLTAIVAVQAAAIAYWSFSGFAARAATARTAPVDSRA
jgi:MFS family permease